MVCTLIGQLSEAAQRAQLGSLRGRNSTHQLWQPVLWSSKKKSGKMDNLLQLSRSTGSNYERRSSSPFRSRRTQICFEVLLFPDRYRSRLPAKRTALTPASRSASAAHGGSSPSHFTALVAHAYALRQRGRGRSAERVEELMAKAEALDLDPMLRVLARLIECGGDGAPKRRDRERFELPLYDPSAFRCGDQPWLAPSRLRAQLAPFAGIKAVGRVLLVGADTGAFGTKRAGDGFPRDLTILPLKLDGDGRIVPPELGVRRHTRAPDQATEEMQRRPRARRRARRRARGAARRDHDVAVASRQRAPSSTLASARVFGWDCRRGVRTTVTPSLDAAALAAAAAPSPAAEHALIRCAANAALGLPSDVFAWDARAECMGLAPRWCAPRSRFAPFRALAPALRRVCAAGTRVRQLQAFIHDVRERRAGSGSHQELQGFAEGVAAFVRLHEALVVRKLLSPAVVEIALIATTATTTGGQRCDGGGGADHAPSTLLEMLHCCAPFFANVACVARLCGVFVVGNSARASSGLGLGSSCEGGDDPNAAIAVGELSGAELLDRLYAAVLRVSLLDAETTTTLRSSVATPQRICEVLFARTFEPFLERIALWAFRGHHGEEQASFGDLPSFLSHVRDDLERAGQGLAVLRRSDMRHFACAAVDAGDADTPLQMHRERSAAARRLQRAVLEATRHAVLLEEVRAAAVVPKRSELLPEEQERVVASARRRARRREISEAEALNSAERAARRREELLDTSARAEVARAARIARKAEAMRTERERVDLASSSASPATLGIASPQLSAEDVERARRTLFQQYGVDGAEVEVEVGAEAEAAAATVAVAAPAAALEERSVDQLWEEALPPPSPSSSLLLEEEGSSPPPSPPPPPPPLTPRAPSSPMAAALVVATPTPTPAVAAAGGAAVAGVVAVQRSSVAVSQAPGGDSTLGLHFNGLGGAASANVLLTTPLQQRGPSSLQIFLSARKPAPREMKAFAAPAPLEFGTKKILGGELMRVFRSFLEVEPLEKNENEGDDERELLPLSVALEMCIATPLKSQRNAVDAAQLELLLGKLRLREHLAALRHFMLGAAGLFIKCVVDELFSSDSSTAHKLSALATAESLKVSGLERAAFSDRFGYTTTMSTETAAARDVFAHVEPTYALKAEESALAVVITPSSLKLYGVLHRRILRLKYAESALLRVFQQVRGGGAATPIHDVDEAVRRLQRLRYEMQHVVQSISGHLVMQLVHASWRPLLAKIDAAREVKTLAAAHDAYLADLAHGGFVCRSENEVGACVERIFGDAVALGELTQRWEQVTMANVSEEAYIYMCVCAAAHSLLFLARVLPPR